MTQEASITGADVRQALNDIPPAGSRIKIVYPDEGNSLRYNIDNYKKGGRKLKINEREAVILQKTEKGARSCFAVEMLPEKEAGKRGRHRQSFKVLDIMRGDVEVVERCDTQGGEQERSAES